MSNLIKTSTGKLIKYTTDVTFEACDGFTTTKPLPTQNHSILSGISPTSTSYGQQVIITNGDEICTYISNSDNTFSPATGVYPFTADAVYIVPITTLSVNYAGKYYLRSTKTWLSTLPKVNKLIKIN